MVRPKSRKTVEELYATAPPSTLGRFEENFFQNSKNNKSHKVIDKTDLSNSNPKACRKKSKTPCITIGEAEKKDEKTLINEEMLFGKYTKSKKSGGFVSSSFDNKHLPSYVEETEKDEDTEEFFELIRETVENAVGKTLSDILNRNFREVNAKLDSTREQLKATDDKLEKIQTDINNSKDILDINTQNFCTNKNVDNKMLAVLPEIVHYGEENSRHFRYLCMKSEYDKMFYQHQNIMTSMPVDARPNIINPYPQQFGPQGPTIPQTMTTAQQTNQQQASQQSVNYSTGQTKSSTLPGQSQCKCHNSGCGDFDGMERSKSSVSTKSSEMSIKEVKELLEQLQKIYATQEGNKKDGDCGAKDARGDIALDIQNDSGDGDEDDEDSSDEMSSPSIEEHLGAGGDS